MPRAAVFDRGKILAAAVELVGAEGIEALSARNVAARLGASTAPLYASFDSIEALRAAVLDEARRRLRAHTQKPWTEKPFLNEGTGLVVFARDEPRLFAALFLTPDVAKDTVPRVYDDLLADMKNDARFAAFSDHERDRVLEKLWFVSLGMATLAYSGQLKAPTTHAIMTALLDAGSVLIPDAIARLKKA